MRNCYCIHGKNAFRNNVIMYHFIYFGSAKVKMFSKNFSAS